MHDSLRSRLKAYEQAPPPSVWNNISRQLDEQFIAADSTLSSRLENYAVTAPAGIWENIEKEINSTEDIIANPTAKVVPLFSRRVAVAVIFFSVIAVASLYFFTGNNNQQLADTQSQKSTTYQENAVPVDTVVTGAGNGAVGVADEQEVQSRKILLASVSPAKTKKTEGNRNNNDNISSYEAVYANTIEEAHLATPQPVAEPQFISVSAPPIRDRNGNIIMDLDIIRKPGQQYITVTSPNGNQTRISNKFLNCLRYINGNISSAEMDGTALECRTQFENWRNRLLVDGSFIPAADNFFDIFELKEMIQD